MIKTFSVDKGFSLGGKEVLVLKDINIDIQAGEFVSIMGPSGSGKSTLLYLLGALDKPTRGSIVVDGNELAKMSDKEESAFRRQKLGFVFQFYNLIANLSVEENILVPILLNGEKARDYRERLAEVLAVTGLTNLRRHLPSELSGGQQQRAAIARAIIHSPKIILADEPTGNLDSKMGGEIMDLFQEINLKGGRTIIQVTHSPEAARCGNRTLVLKDGKIVDSLSA